MRILGNLTCMQHRFCHGGCEVLRVCLDLPSGDTAAAKHFAAIIEALDKHAKDVLLPRAAAELEQLAAAGQTHTFRPHRYRASLCEQAKKQGVAVTLRITHSQRGMDGQSVLFHRELATFWDKNGLFQRKNKKKDG